MANPANPSRSRPVHLRLARAPLGLLPILLALTFGCGGSESHSGPPTPYTLSVAEGNGTSAPAGTVVPSGPVVEVRSRDGDPLEGVTIQFQVLEGGGYVADPSVSTDSLGRAAGVWILGRESGTVQKLEASSGSLSVELTAQAVAASPGSTFLGREGYTEYLAGSLPLVLTAPHGGYLEPPEIPNRGWGVTARDRNTRELTLAIRAALHARTGAYPHVVISNLHRRKLDPNREILEAAQGNPLSERAWWEFQIFAEEAGNLVEEALGEGLHLDIHGHAHDIDRLELGYLLSSTDLAQPDSTLSGSVYANKSSVRALAGKAGNDLASLIRGPRSLGTLLEDRLVPTVPSTAQPNPGQDDYFTGGYNTVRHGSREGGSMSGIQIEHHYPGLRDEAQNRERYAEALAEALVLFYRAHFGFELAPGSPPE